MAVFLDFVPTEMRTQFWSRGLMANGHWHCSRRTSISAMRTWRPKDSRNNCCRCSRDRVTGASCPVLRLKAPATTQISPTVRSGRALPDINDRQSVGRRGRHPGLPQEQEFVCTIPGWPMPISKLNPVTEPTRRAASCHPFGLRYP